jgi:hypothetical protein
MIPLIKSLSIDEFLKRINPQLEQGNTCSALITSSLNSQQLVEDLQETLNLFPKCEVGCFSANDKTNTLVQQIINAIEDSATKAILYDLSWGFEQYDTVGIDEEFDKIANEGNTPYDADKSVEDIIERARLKLKAKETKCIL